MNYLLRITFFFTIAFLSAIDTYSNDLSDGIARDTIQAINLSAPGYEFSWPELSQPEIMAGPTYVVYQVVSSRDGIVNDCFRCMNNHLPGYCRARYVYETRRYTEYDEDGEIVSEWMQTVSLFMGCE